MSNGFEAVRPRLGDIVRETITEDYLRDLLHQITTATKGVRAEAALECKACGHHNRKIVTVQIPDWDRQIRALTDLIDQIEGKPGTANVEEAGLTLVVKRNWPERGD